MEAGTLPKNTAKQNMSSAVCVSSMYSHLCMKMLSFLFVCACAMPRLICYIHHVEFHFRFRRLVSFPSVTRIYSNIRILGTEYQIFAQEHNFLLTNILDIISANLIKTNIFDICNLSGCKERIYLTFVFVRSLNLYIFDICLVARNKYI